MNLRLALLAIVATATAAYAEDWSIRSPDGWVRVDATGVFDAEALPGIAHRYTSPDVPSDELAVIKLQLVANGTPRKLTEELLARVVVEQPMRVEHRATRGPVAGDAEGEMTLVDGDTVRRFRILAAPNHRDHMIDVVFARCTTSTATAPACAEALASVKLESKPPVTIDTDNAFVRPAKWILGGIVVAAWIFMLVRYLLRRRAMQKKTPLSDGEIVTLTGKVRSTDILVVAPLSGTSCVLHRSRMHLLGAPNAKNNVAIECSRFVVETPNGDVLVDSTPDLDLVPSPVVPRQEDRERTFMTTRGIPEARHRDAGFDEIVIAAGATVVIRGMIKIDLDHSAAGERGYRDDAPTVARLVGVPAAPLVIKKTW